MMCRFLLCSDQDSPDPAVSYEVPSSRTLKLKVLAPVLKTRPLSGLVSSAGVEEVERADSRRRVPLLRQREQADR